MNEPGWQITIRLGKDGGAMVQTGLWHPDGFITRQIDVASDTKNIPGLVQTAVEVSKKTYRTRLKAQAEKAA